MKRFCDHLIIWAIVLATAVGLMALLQWATGWPFLPLNMGRWIAFCVGITGGYIAVQVAHLERVRRFFKAAIAWLNPTSDKDRAVQSVLSEIEKARGKR